MSRQVSNDFKNFLQYIKLYNISPLLDNPIFLSNLSQQHKKYYSYLTLLGEISRQKPEGMDSEQFSYLLESCSDVGNGLFSLINGSYKSSNLILRSSIENFLKGTFLNEVPDITSDKSMYRIIDNVKESLIYNNSQIKPLLNTIISNYKYLCEDVHTARNENMAHITALKYFPSFDEIRAKKTTAYLTTLTSNYLTITCMLNKQYTLKIHHVNRDIIFSNIIRKCRPLIHGID